MATTRPMMSVTPPGANGMTNRTGLLGYGSSAARAAESGNTMESASSTPQIPASIDFLFGMRTSFMFQFPTSIIPLPRLVENKIRLPRFLRLFAANLQQDNRAQDNQPDHILDGPRIEQQKP
jgi:hypothetical protein